MLTSYHETTAFVKLLGLQFCDNFGCFKPAKGVLTVYSAFSMLE